MAFAEDITRHAEQVRNRLPHVRGEEATKHSLIIPLLQVLGYDVFDPREVQPEYVADFAQKRTGQLEKIDYAICSGGVPVMFVECKAHDAALEDHMGQLARYFNATPSVRVAVLTNGVQLKVFTDLQQANMMDASAWLEIDLRTLKPVEIDALARLRKTDFSAEQVVALAEEMVYYNRMVVHIGAMLREPSESFVRFVAGETLQGTRLSKGLVERLTPILKKAIQSSILEHVAKSFSTIPDERAPEPLVSGVQPVIPPEPEDAGTATTPEELEAFEQVSRWVREVKPDAPVAYRDSRNYLAMNQCNKKKWFLRLNIQKPPFWITFRHVAPEELRALAPGMEIGSGGNLGDSRASLAGPADLPKLRAAAIRAYEREASRGADEADASEPEALKLPLVN